MSLEEFLPLEDYVYRSSDEIKARAMDFYRQIRTRRTVRDYSSQAVSRDIIETCLRAAGTAGQRLTPAQHV